MSLVTRIAQEFNDVRNHLPISTPYNLLEGTLSITNEVITNGFSTTLYTGNGGAQVITDNVDMSTKWGNDVSEKFGGLRWLKSRSAATNNFLFDTIRGVEKEINSNTTEAEATLTGSLTAFGNTGFSVGSAAGINTNLATYASWNFQTTHRRTGITNHGKAFTEHYNPFTGFTIIKYEGSGLAGHEIPHSLGRKLGFVTVKNLSAVADWWASTDSVGLYLNLTNAQNQYKAIFNEQNTLIDATASGATNNTSTNQYILYGWANSYLDESNKLIGNYEIGVYQGNGVAGNKVTTKGKPAWILTKRLDSTSNWAISDCLRNSFDYLLFSNLSMAEDTTINWLDVLPDGFRLNYTDANWNASGGQYLYMVVYDNDTGSGKSKYPRATDSSQLTINNAIIPFAQGIDSNGTKVSTLSKNETITGLTYTAGKNYVYAKLDGTYGVSKYRPRYLESDLKAEVAGDNPDYFDVLKNKWFSTVANPELVTNGAFDTNTTGWVAGANTTISIDNGNLKVLQTTTTAGYAYQIISTVVGKKYVIKTTLSYESVATVGHLYVSSLGANLSDIVYNNSGLGTKAIEFVAQSTQTYITLKNSYSVASSYSEFDNVSVHELDLEIGSEITTGRNYLNHVVYTDASGQLAYVRELPKIEYKDIVKANEYQGKNVCTAWVNFDGTTTPPTIRDSYNVASVVRVAPGTYDIYFKENMHNINFSINITSWRVQTYVNSGDQLYQDSFRLNKTQVQHFENSVGVNSSVINIQIFGGKNV